MFPPFKIEESSRLLWFYI
jgi:hypothetical protein